MHITSIPFSLTYACVSAFSLKRRLKSDFDKRAKTSLKLYCSISTPRLRGSKSASSKRLPSTGLPEFATRFFISHNLPRHQALSRYPLHSAQRYNKIRTSGNKKDINTIYVVKLYKKYKSKRHILFILLHIFCFISYLCISQNRIDKHGPAAVSMLSGKRKHQLYKQH